MAELIALCMSCKANDDAEQMQEMKDISIEENNNRYAARGTCSNCGSKMFKFLSKDQAEELRSELD